jgi:predicted nucleotidyltransferase
LRGFPLIFGWSKRYFLARARGEHSPDSDADVALILHERGDDGMTLMMLAELAYYAYLDTEIMVQPVPIAIEDWLNLVLIKPL